jgi:hypothetical protein
VAVPADRNVTQKGAGRKLKYKNLCIEIQQMWNMKCVIRLLIIEITGIIMEGLEKHFDGVQGKHSVDSLQKMAVLGECHTQYGRCCSLKF